MGIDEYIELIQSQIRDKHAKQFVADEIRNHIEEQVEDNLKKGMNSKQAIYEAVKDMGDPVSVGVDMDKVHRPHTDFGLITAILLLSMFNILVQYMVAKEMNDLQYFQKNLIFSTLCGMCAMFVMYRLDYTFFLKKSRIIGGAFCILTVVLNLVLSGTVHGLLAWGTGNSFRCVSMNAIMFLYLPIFGAILYEYRGGKITSILKILAWMSLPLFVKILFNTITIPYLVVIMMSEIILLIFAVNKGWYRITVKEKLLLIMSILVVFGMIMTGGLLYVWKFQHERFINQTERVKNWILNLNDFFATNVETYNRTKQILAESNLFTESREAVDRLFAVSDVKTNHILEIISAYFGVAAMIITVAYMIGLCGYLFYKIIRQKNNLGLIVGFAALTAEAIRVIFCISVLIGLIPKTGCNLPFLSSDNTFLIVDYMLMGIILSVFRYKDIRKERKVLVERTEGRTLI